MKRRDFLKLSAAGVATLVIGKIPGLGLRNAFGATQTINVTITDAIKEMVTHNAINNAECYFWVYKMTADGVAIPADCPGPTILAVKGQSITINVTNELDEPHAFFIPGMFDSGPIAPGATFTGTFTASKSGAFLYYDNLNTPVNRVMGLHGALVVRPAAGAVGHNITPYDNPTPRVQELFDAFGSAEHFPGLAWHQGDATAPPLRQYVWLCHQASPKLFAEVGSLPAGEIYDSAAFMNAFLRAPFSATNAGTKPQYFTINGQSGFFSHFSPAITPMGRVGEPCVVHIMNAGLWTHAMHLHGNHFYITGRNGNPASNLLWLDTYNVFPMDIIDYTVPFVRPPDIPNALGIGTPATPLVSPVSGRPVYPPVQELDVYMPAPGQDVARDINGNAIDLMQRQSPLCYPMHDHSEPSQTAQGGNYNCGLISGMYIIGDRNVPGHFDFPMDHDFAAMYRGIRGISEGVAPAPGMPPME